MTKQSSQNNSQKRFAVKDKRGRYFAAFDKKGGPVWGARPTPLSRLEAEYVTALAPKTTMIPTRYKPTKEEKQLRKMLGDTLLEKAAKQYFAVHREKKFAHVGEVAKFVGSGEHGKTFDYEIALPLTTEIVDCAEDDDDPEYVVWLTAAWSGGPKHHITTVTSPHGCVLRSGLVEAAFTAFLKTPNGQTAALEFIKHDLGLEDKVA